MLRGSARVNGAVLLTCEKRVHPHPTIPVTIRSVVYQAATTNNRGERVASPNGAWVGVQRRGRVDVADQERAPPAYTVWAFTEHCDVIAAAAGFDSAQAFSAAHPHIRPEGN